MKQTLLLALALTLLLFTTQARAQSTSASKPTHALDIKTSPDNKSFIITPKSTQDASWGLIEVVHAKSGNVARVLHAGRITRDTSITFTPDSSLNLKPGEYVVRIRDGISLAFDKPIPRPDSPDGKWVNPTHLALQNGFLYIGEAGAAIPEIVAQRSPELTWNTRDGKTVKGICARVEDGNALIVVTDPATSTVSVVPVDPGTQTPAASAVAMDVMKQTSDWRALIKHSQPFVVKLGPDGKPASNWGNQGYWRDIPVSSGVMHAMALSDDGNLYMPAGDNTVQYAGPLGLREQRNIGDFTGTAPRSLAVAGSSKLYVVPYTGYTRLFAADRTKTGAAANLYNVTPFRNGSWITNSITADDQGNIYMADEPGNLVKIVDTGKTLEEKYVHTAEPKFYGLGGVNLSKGIITAAVHGPGPGPFWDSGGGGEIALFFDDGKALKLLARIGTPGQSTDPIEFLNPRSVVITPDHKYLYVAEDGWTNTEGPPGNARVSRFILKSTLEESVPLQINK
jgi:hypothetical protein